MQLQVCEALFVLLTRAFQSNNFNDIDVLLDGIFGGRFLNQDFEKCFFEKLDTKLISQIVQYMGNNQRSARFYPTPLAVLLWDYALKNENGAKLRMPSLESVETKAIHCRIISCSDLNIDHRTCSIQ